MTATLTVRRADGSSHAAPHPTVKHAQAEARGVVLNPRSDAEAVTVAEGGRELERWTRDGRSGQWRHVQGVTIGVSW